MAALNVFVYGSLMYRAVWDRVVSAPYAGRPAVLPGYRRSGLRDAPYPGAVVDPAARIEGRVWMNVAPRDVERLDAFEGAEYRRVPVGVHVDGDLIPAQVYVFLDPRRLTGTDWDAVAFEREHLEVFADAHGVRGGSAGGADPA